MQKIKLIVGRSDIVDTLPRRYYVNGNAVLKACRRYAKKFGTIYTSSSTVCVAFQCLHRMKEYDVSIIRVRNGVETKYNLDVKGDLIQPWPDEFFELDFQLRFFNGVDYDN